MFNISQTLWFLLLKVLDTGSQCLYQIIHRTMKLCIGQKLDFIIEITNLCIPSGIFSWNR